MIVCKYVYHLHMCAITRATACVRADTNAHKYRICILTSVWRHSASLSAHNRHTCLCRKNVNYGLFSILTQLSFLLVPLICPPPALCVKRSRSWKINCLQRKLSDITPTLDSAHPICTKPTRLICSHCKCLLSPKQFFLDYVTSCWCPREFISRITFILD